tara:strand:+ start:28 stop:306 length:279 start_codon:yes stop_codon:yes gene_type:complete
MRKYATRRLVAKNVPVALAQYFPQGKFRLRGRGNRTYPALHAAVRREKYEKYTGNFKDFDKLEPVVRYKMLLAKFRQDLPLEYADHMTVYLK